MAYMYGGAILRVDLGSREISTEPTSAYSSAFLGGRGINIRLLYDGTAPNDDPLDPLCPLVFGVGPLAGTPIPASRVEVTAKSPETGFLGSSNFGGSFGPELKFAGYDHVVITGKAERPVYIWIVNNRVEIRDASNIWGKDTYETQAILRSEEDPEAKIACIGQAGENLVHYATVQHELGHSAGRTGMGAVMGSKNLKAIVVRGTKGIALAAPKLYLSIADEMQQELRRDPRVQQTQQEGMAAEENEARHRLWDPDWKKVNIFELNLKYKPRRTGCIGCPQQCMDLYPVEAKGGGVISCALYDAPLHQVRSTDLELMLECGLQCQRYGIDVVSTFSIIAWLMELYEMGLITAEDTDGIPLEWGSQHAIRSMFRKIVYREGLGDVLANGILPAADAIGRGARDYANQVKGLPLYSAYTPKRLIPTKGQSLGVVVSSRGDSIRTQVYIEWLQQTVAEATDDTRRGLKRITGTERAALSEEYEGKAELVAYIEDGIIIDDCLSVCKFFGGSFQGVVPAKERHLARLLSAGSGIEIDEGALFAIARRVRNLERVYCVREGMTRETDSLPKRWMDTPIDRGDFKGVKLDSVKFEEMKSRYYSIRDWDIFTGIPTRPALQRTGLGDVADDLDNRGLLPQEQAPRNPSSV